LDEEIEAIQEMIIKNEARIEKSIFWCILDYESAGDMKISVESKTVFFLAFEGFGLLPDN